MTYNIYGAEWKKDDWDISLSEWEKVMVLGIRPIDADFQWWWVIIRNRTSHDLPLYADKQDGMLAGDYAFCRLKLWEEL